ncbi:MAG: hypothetical protein O3A20_09050 [Planctomycetota bacterium]|nr:hypothetical protein [Planctomycetota bacterium]
MKTILMSALLAFGLEPFATAQQTEPTAQPADASAVKVLQAQTTCPVSGETLENKDFFVEYQGNRIYTCCAKCKVKVVAFPDYWLYRLHSEGFMVENVQTTCPVSGEELDAAAKSVEVGPMTIKTCCAKCAKKVAADPAKYMDVLAGRHAQELCPVSGKKIEGDDSFMYQGVSIRACCPNCEAKFTAEPEKYLKAMTERKEIVTQTEAVCLTHPNEKIKDRTWFTTVGPVRYYFANRECMTAFFREPAKYVPALRSVLPGKKAADAEKTGA